MRFHHFFYSVFIVSTGRRAVGNEKVSSQNIRGGGMSMLSGQPMSTTDGQKARFCTKNKYTKQRKKVLTKRKSDVIMTASKDIRHGPRGPVTTL